MRRRILVLALAVPFLLASVAPILAQTPKPTASKPAAKFTKAQLDQFASAAIDVYRISTQQEVRWRQAAAPAEKDKIQAEAKAQQEAAVKKHGLSLDTYNQILLASKSDKALNDEIAAIIQAKTPS